MKYSIIIPTLNEEKLIPRLLEKLNSNNIKEKFDVEIIVSDGGSTDRTIELTFPYADIIKIHREETKQNIATGRNEGAKFATGEILVFLNADIMFNDVDAFFYYLEGHFAHKEFAAFTCYVKVFPEEQTIADKLYHSVYNTFFRLLNNYGGGMGRGECQVVRKKIFEELQGYNQNMAAGEDLDFFRRVKKLGKILFSKDICVYESPRRYRKYGYFYITISWIKNGVSVLFKRRSLSKVWEQVR